MIILGRIRSFKGTSINSPFCKNFNNYWTPEHFCALFVFGLHLFDFHSITMPPHCAFVQTKHLLAQNSKIITKEFIEIPLSLLKTQIDIAESIDFHHSRKHAIVETERHRVAVIVVGGNGIGRHSVGAVHSQIVASTRASDGKCVGTDQQFHIVDTGVAKHVRQRQNIGVMASTIGGVEIPTPLDRVVRDLVFALARQQRKQQQNQTDRAFHLQKNQPLDNRQTAGFQLVAEAGLEPTTSGL